MYCSFGFGYLMANYWQALGYPEFKLKNVNHCLGSKQDQI